MDFIALSRVLRNGLNCTPETEILIDQRTVTKKINPLSKLINSLTSQGEWIKNETSLQWCKWKHCSKLILNENFAWNWFRSKKSQMYFNLVKVWNKSMTNKRCPISRTTDARWGNPLHCTPKINSHSQILSTAEAYFVCHIGPNFQIYAFIGCPYSVILIPIVLNWKWMKEKLSRFQFQKWLKEIGHNLSMISYLRSASYKKTLFIFFSIKKAFSTPEKWKWNWLGILSFIFSLGQCVWFWGWLILKHLLNVRVAGGIAFDPHNFGWRHSGR